MSHLHAVGDLYRHQAWADAAIWRAVAASDAAWNDAVIQERLGHAHLVEWLFLERPLPWAAMIEQRLGRAPGPVTLGETLLQVPMHSTYHRGQIATRLREVGGEPPPTDFIVWAFLGKATSRVAAGDIPLTTAGETR